MKRLSTMQLIPGMVIAQDVIGFDQCRMMDKGTVLTTALISRLDLYGIQTVYVGDIGLAAPPKEIQAEQSYYQRIRNSPQFGAFRAKYDAQLEEFRQTMHFLAKKHLALDLKKLLNRTLDIASAAKGPFGMIDLLQNMREYDDCTFAHSLNVGLISNCLARWHRLPEEDIELATACGLFHDIGKLLMPQQILTKPDLLSKDEYAVIQNHPQEGYDLLKSHGVSDPVCQAALKHHERLDGSGYPSGLTGGDIPPFARLVAIADVYDAMTAARIYRPPLCPFQAVEQLEKDGLGKFDAGFLMTFLSNVANTYLQTHCRLSDGTVGRIIYINTHHLSRPVVQCGNTYIDLAQRRDLSVASIV